MATKIFLKQPLSSWNSAYSYANPTASVLAFITSVTNTTASGTKIQATATGGGTVLKWISKPVLTPFTCSGTVTFNLWAKEAANANNAGIRMELVKYSGSEGSVFASATFGAPTELTTTMAVKNWTVTPTSTDFTAGDRIVAYVYIVNVGTMGAGTPGVTMDYGGLTAAADGDSWVQLNENVIFQSEGEFIQRKDQSPGGTRSSDVLTAFSGTCAAGELIWIWITWFSTTITITLADNQGNTYTPIFGPIQDWLSTGNTSEAWYAKNIAGGSAITITVTYSGSITGTVYINLSDYDGLDTTSPLDQTNNAATTSTAANGMDSGSKTTLFQNELIVGGGWSDGSLPTVGTNFLLRSDGTGQTASEDRSVTVLGSYKTTETQAAGTNAIMGMSTFKWGTQATSYEDDSPKYLQTITDDSIVTIWQ